MSKDLSKPCVRCGAVDRSYSTGRCRPCQTRKAREWQAAHPERRREIKAREARKLSERAKVAREQRRSERLNRPCVKCGAVDRYPKTAACRACAHRAGRAAYQKPDVRARVRARRSLPEVREAQALRAKTPRYKAKMRRWYERWISRPEVVARLPLLRRKQRFGVSEAEQAAMLLAQGHCCAACGDPLRPGQGTHLDHDHATGKVRAFLCRSCNVAIAHLRDSPLRAEKIATYLRKHQPSLPLVDVRTRLPLRRVHDSAHGLGRPIGAEGNRHGPSICSGADDK
jgi:hypothetical protein